MNGWYDGANDAARERIQHFRRQAEHDRAANMAQAVRPRLGAFHLARKRAATALYRLADALAPRSIPPSSDGLTARSAERRPVA